MLVYDSIYGVQDMQISKAGDMYHVVSDKSGPWGYVQVKIDHGDELSPENERLFIVKPFQRHKRLCLCCQVPINIESQRTQICHHHSMNHRL